VVDLEGKEYSFEARLCETGYIHKIEVLINGLEVVFEPDEERNYRALLTEKDRLLAKDKDIELIKIVGELIEATKLNC